MTRLKEPPFTHDIVGSFLRPARLKQARADAESGTITRNELTRIENECITELIHKEKENGLYAFTDGEFRRAFWHLDFMAALTGCTTAAAEHWSVAFKGRQPKATNLKIIGRLDFPENHFRFIHQFEDASHIAKQTIPSPSMVHLMTCVRVDPDLPEVSIRITKISFLKTLSTHTAKHSVPSMMPDAATFSWMIPPGVNSVPAKRQKPIANADMIFHPFRKNMFM